MRRIALCGVLILASAALAHASIHLVNPDGSGDFPTIQAAVDGSAIGDTILLAPGVFTGAGNWDLTIPRPRLLAAAGEPGSAILDADGERYAALGEDPDASEIFRFEGIIFRYGDGIEAWHNKQLEFADCRFEHSSSLVIVYSYVIPLGIIRAEDCDFVGNSGVLGARFVELMGCGFSFNVGRLSDSYDLEAVDCRFHGNYNLDGGYGSIFSLGADCFYSSNYSFTDCSFYQNAADMLFWVPEPCANANNLTLQGCTFVDGLGPGTCDLRLENLQYPATLERCIFAFRGEGQAIVVGEGAAVPQLTDCDLFGNAGGDWVGVIADQLGVGCNMSEGPAFCDWLEGNLTLNYNSPCLPDNNDCGVQIGAEGQGCTQGTPVPPSPAAKATLTAQPNPFNPKVTLRFALDAAGPATLAIYTASGRLVATLLNGATLPAGESVMDWNAGDLPSGVYLAQLATPAGTEQLKLTMLR